MLLSADPENEIAVFSGRSAEEGSEGNQENGSGLVKSLTLMKDGTEIQNEGEISLKLSETFSVNIALQPLVTNADTGSGDVNYRDGIEYMLFKMPAEIARWEANNSVPVYQKSGRMFGTLNYYSDGWVSLTASTDESGDTLYNATLSVEVSLAEDKIDGREEVPLEFVVGENATYSFTVKILDNVKTPPTMTKEYKTDPTDSTIQHWTVTITEGSQIYENGWKFEDTIGGDLEYYDSLSVTDPSDVTVSVDEFSAVSEDKKTISFSLTPSGNKGAKWTITYDTHTVNSSIDVTKAGTAKITSKIENIANLYDVAVVPTLLATASKTDKVEKVALTVAKEGKKETKEDGSSYIDYTITVHADGYTFQNVIVYDLVEGTPVTASAANLVFDEMSSGGGTVTYADDTNHVATATETDSNTSQTYSMKVELGTISGPNDYVITYSVSVDKWSEYRKYNEPDVKNYAWMTFETEDGKGTYAVPRIDSGGKTLVAGSLEKSGSYEPSTNEITWKITVNKEKSVIGDVVIEDIISGSDYVEGGELQKQEYVRYQNLEIEGNSTTPIEGTQFADTDESGNGNVRFTFSTANGLNLNGRTATFEVVTKPKEEDYYQDNLNDTNAFQNTVNLYMDTEVETPAITVDAYCSANSTVLAKSAGAYNYAENTIPWTIKVNESQMALVHPVITDTLPAGLSLVDGSLKVSGGGESEPKALPKKDSGIYDVDAVGEYYTYDEASGVITVYLKSANARDAVRTITFDSLVDVENAVFGGNAVRTHNGDITVTNTVTLDTDERDTSVEVSTPYTWDNQLLGKTGKSEGNGNIDYSVVINKTGIELPANTVVTDTMSAGLTLSPSSIALYRVTVASDGSYTKGDSAENWSYDTESGTDGSTILRVTLPKNAGTSAYLLTYCARVSNSDSKSYPSYDNNVTMRGLSSDSNKVSVETAYGSVLASGYADSYNPSVLKILAVDEAEKPLPGATYALSYDSHELAEDTTDGTGTLTYRAVDTCVDYEVKQVEAPEGYELVDIKPGCGTVDPAVEHAAATLQVEKEGVKYMTQVEFVYALKSTELSFTKVNESGEALPGAEFTLYKVGTGDDSEETLTVSATAKSDADGKVSFPKVTAGKYRIFETAAPEGYLKSSKQIVAVVNANAEITSFYFLGDTEGTTVTTYENELKQAGTVSITVRSEGTKEALPGAAFVLYRVVTDESTKEKTEEYVAETTSDEDGRVTFTDLPEGIYKIRQTNAPYAYTYDDLTLVAVLENDEDGDAMLTALYVEGDEEKKEVPAVYDTMLPTTDVTFVSTSSEDGSRLAGAQFGLYVKTVGADGAESWEELFTATSGTDGTVTFSGIAGGDYEIRLITEPEGYRVVEDTQIVLSVSEDGKLETFYFKGETEENLLADGEIVEVPFDVEKTVETPAENPVETPAEKAVETEEPESTEETEKPAEESEESAEEDPAYSGGTWDKTHTYLVSPKTGEEDSIFSNLLTMLRLVYGTSRDRKNVQ